VKFFIFIIFYKQLSCRALANTNYKASTRTTASYVIKFSNTLFIVFLHKKMFLVKCLLIV